MKFNVNQQDLQQALNYCQGVIEKRNTLPILSNVLLSATNSILTITATDLDLIFIHQIDNVEVLEEGNTTTTSSIMFTATSLAGPTRSSIPRPPTRSLTIVTFVFQLLLVKGNTHLKKHLVGPIKLVRVSHESV